MKTLCTMVALMAGGLCVVGSGCAQNREVAQDQDVGMVEDQERARREQADLRNAERIAADERAAQEAARNRQNPGTGTETGNRMFDNGRILTGGTTAEERARGVER